MTTKLSRASRLFLILALGFLAGCIGGVSQQSVYYVLSPLQGQSSGQSPDFEPGLGVGPIKIPEFLKRPQIVARQDKNELIINEFHRWGDSLEAQTINVLVENLSNLLNTSNISAYPWERHFVPKYQLYIDFRRFEGAAAGPVVLEAVWWVVETQKNKQVFTRRSSFRESIGGEGYKAYVKALNTALEKLSREMADRLIEEDLW